MKKGDAPIEYGYNWLHWCRKALKAIWRMDDRCSKCGDPAPRVQREIDRRSAAMLRGAKR